MEEQVTRLQDEFALRTASDDIEIIGGHNPSHLAGVGDLLQAVTQAFYKPVSSYDLDTILMQIEPQVKTRKILLVGHSQGTYYTNELYKYLTTHGVPKESVGVYNIATPASYVAGGGGYVTSTNDKIINLIRTAQVEGNVNTYTESYYTIGHIVDSSLRANITITQEAGHKENSWGGHGLDVYLDGAAPRIMGDIDASLKRLKASGGTTEGSCFEPPQEDLAYKTKSILYSVADPLFGGTKTLTSSLKGGAEDFTDYVASGVNETKHFAQSLFRNLAAANTNNTGHVAAAVLAKPQISAASKAVAASPTAQQSESVEVVDETTQNNESSELISEQEVPPAVAGPTVPDPAPQVSPGFGGGGSAVVAATSSSAASLSVISPANNAHIATSSIEFTGSADPGAGITATYGTSTATTTTDGSGNWTLAMSLPEGTAIVEFVAADLANKNSSIVTRHLTIDTIAPATPILSIAECAASVVMSFCVVPATTLTLEWSGIDANTFSLYQQNVFVGSFTSTSSPHVVTDNATSTLKIVSYDLAGNAATSTAVEVYAVNQPLIINEIGWGGTDTGIASGQQWIELKNMTTLPIDLSNFVIARSTGESISLAGASIPGSGKLVVEQSNLQIFGTGEFIVPFSDLSTVASEQLSLVWNTTTVDASPSVDDCSTWCEGAFHVAVGSNVSGATGITSSLSMERLAGSVDGTLPGSWKTYDSYGPWDSPEGGNFWGTSGVENSYGFPDSAVYCGTNDNLITPGTAAVPFNTGSGICVYLSKFISADFQGARRFGGLRMGTVGSSTSVHGHAMVRSAAFVTQDRVPDGTPTGTEFFYWIFEANIAQLPNVTTLFSNYFAHGEDPLNGGNPPPHGNYVTISFTYQP